MTDSVFVSYSRSDRRIATLVVQLLRAREDVFYDVDNIPAGERWREVIDQAIDNASHFYLLWCKHSADSQEVRSEWERAISRNKRLVPVLLDSTRLFEPLTKYQWVDFRGVVQGHSAPRKASLATWTFAIAGLALFVVAAVAYRFVLPSRDPTVAPSVRPGVWVALSVVGVLVLGVLVARWYQRRRRARLATEHLAEAIAQDLAAH